MNGVQFKEYWDSITDQAFSDWFDSAQLNILAKAALYKSIEYKVATNDRQQVHDDLFSLVSISDEVGNNSFSPSYNRVALKTTISDYLHVYAVKCLFSEPIYTTIEDATNTTPIVIKLTSATKLRGDRGLKTKPSVVNITDITGNTAANGISSLKQLNAYEYALYNDLELTIPKSGNGKYVSGGTIKLLHDNWAQPINSNERMSALNAPTIYNPRYTIADGTLAILPFEALCTTVKIDYIKKPTVFIDVTDTTIDLEESYTQRFLYFIADKLAEICKQSQKDYEMAQAASQQMQTP